LARATPTSFNSSFFDVPLTWLPSAMFLFPLRAACTIWSRVRERGSIKRLQNTTVASCIISAI
jgi:hypothetical protein